MAPRAEITLSILAKAPQPGLAKTRLAAALGEQGAAELAVRLIVRTIATATAAAIGPVVLWTAPDEHHPLFQALRETSGVTLARQPEGDLGARMLASLARAPALVIGTDCPTLEPAHLRAAADALRDGVDVVVIPAEDGGYALIGAHRPEPALFDDMSWSTPVVMAETRRRMMRLGLSWREPARLWDVDVPEDLKRLADAGLGRLIPGEQPGAQVSDAGSFADRR
jgi:rSAM/selenodomain-associated transferase 1